MTSAGAFWSTLALIGFPLILVLWVMLAGRGTLRPAVAATLLTTAAGIATVAVVDHGLLDRDGGATDLAVVSAIVVGLGAVVAGIGVGVIAGQLRRGEMGVGATVASGSVLAGTFAVAAVTLILLVSH